MSRITCPHLKSLKRIDTKHGRRYKIKCEYDGTFHAFERLSTTTRLNALANENLVEWRVRDAAEIHKTAAMLAFQDGMDKTSFLLAFEQHLIREKARRKRNSPATIGEEIHQGIEASCIEMMRGNSVNAPSATCEESSNAWNNWWRWAQAVNLTPWAVELPVWDDNSAGTIDFVGEIESHVMIADWKTGKALYPEYDLQIADYATTLMGMGIQNEVLFDGGELPALDGAAIVHVSKKANTIVRPRSRTLEEIYDDFGVFMAICKGDGWNRDHAIRQPLAVSAY